MSANKIEISVKDIPEIIEQLKDLEKELEFERKSKNLFINDLYKVCEMSLKLQDQLQQKENIIDKALYWLSENTHYTSLDAKELVLDNGINLKELLEILDKGNK